MEWNVVQLERTKSSRSAPSVTVGNNRIELSAAACLLIDNYEKYGFVEFLTNPNQNSIVGVRLLENATVSSIPAKRKTVDGKPVNGLVIASKPMAQKLFGIRGTQKGTTKYPVTKDSDDILVIHIK